MNHVRILSSAENDIAEALQWYLDQSVPAAERLEQEIDDAVSQIVREPERFPKLYTEHHYLLLKKFPYYIAYRNDSEGILIVAVRHTARDSY